nr:LytTR family DNA-binding domain-containing protein [Thomasclavelia ramosa]
MIFTAQNNGKIYIIDPVKIELIRTEGRELALYDLKKERYVLNKPLYEVQEQLGKDFVRISKFAIINIKRINHVEASFNGTMEIVMKNGLEEIITRSYRKLFKERLGV